MSLEDLQRMLSEYKKERERLSNRLAEFEKEIEWHREPLGALDLLIDQTERALKRVKNLPESDT